MKSRNFGLMAVLFPALLGAASIQGPELGFVFDSAKGQLRPILGIPGAAVLGRPLALGVDVRIAAVSPLQDYVLAISREHNEAMVFAMNRPSLNPVLVQGADKGASQVAISAEGKSAVLYYKMTGRIEIVTGLPGAPKVSTERSATPGQTFTALAVGDDGKTVLAAIPDRLFEIAAGGEVPVLSGLSHAAAISMPAAGTAYVADSGSNEIHRVRGIGGNLEADVIAGSKSGISKPVGLAISQDGTRAYVANGKSRTVSIIDLKDDATVRTIACACTPSGLDRLAGIDTFRLTGVSKQPMWLLEGRAGEPRTLFVPADVASDQK